jgi:hypothetical protein
MLIAVLALLTAQPPMQTMGYSADSLDYLVEPGALSLFGAASLAYEDMNLAADTIRYDPEREVLTATGEPVISEGGRNRLRKLHDLPPPQQDRQNRLRPSWYDRGFYTGERVIMLSRHGSTRREPGSRQARGIPWTGGSGRPP